MDMREKCQKFVDELCFSKHSYEINTIRKNVLRFINESFNEKLGADVNEKRLSYIAADSAIVEIIDLETGLSFRRELPVRYEETGNGVSLIGEDITGKASQISFLSEAAYEKIKDLTGKGPNAPVCPNHNE